MQSVLDILCVNWSYSTKLHLRHAQCNKNLHCTGHRKSNWEWDFVLLQIQTFWQRSQCLQRSLQDIVITEAASQSKERTCCISPCSKATEATFKDKNMKTVPNQVKSQPTLTVPVCLCHIKVHNHRLHTHLIKTEISLYMIKHTLYSTVLWTPSEISAFPDTSGSGDFGFSWDSGHVT